MRVLALDWGTVRVGGAISDPDGKIAFPLDKFIESKTAVTDIKKLVEEMQVGKIIVGLPKNLSGAETDSTKLVQEFVEQLKANIDCQFDYLDERFSSVGAQKSLQAQGLNSKQQRGQVDNLAAAQMLQTYLDTKK